MVCHRHCCFTAQKPPLQTPEFVYCPSLTWSQSFTSLSLITLFVNISSERAGQRVHRKTFELLF